MDPQQAGAHLALEFRMKHNGAVDAVDAALWTTICLTVLAWNEN